LLLAKAIALEAPGYCDFAPPGLQALVTHISKEQRLRRQADSVSRS